ncbi:MAG: sigma 54-interacting transcriptional regulator [Deltaproteobacteria bacterium]|jgi:psp operon transcriptional activator|nr:sigma 54-interacting transcriptional regulator [Deltaproteobacteria bacterium]
MSQNSIPDLLGASETLLYVKERLSAVAKVERPVLILGERGTGKELAAARLHFLSNRWQGPYVTLNCAALSAGLLDAELFGHEAGAFTGAIKRRPGRFEAADGGTLFLDEISHLTLEAQAKILRVVEYGSFQLVGGIQEKKVDARVTAATNADLKKMCRQGTFLPDLWDRLSFEVITLPPLRDRAGDITLLAHYFGARMAQELGWNGAPTFSEELLEALEKHSWPGNVRELKNVIERAVYDSNTKGAEKIVEYDSLKLENEIYWPIDGQEQAETSTASQIGAHKMEAPKIGAPDMGSPKMRDLETIAPISPSSATTASAQAKLKFPLAAGGLDELLELETSRIVEQALTEANFNQARAAELLNISYHRFRSINKKLKKNAKSTS